MNILFSEGSSTSARQSLSALGPLGHGIDICDPQRLCLGRFSRYTRAWHRCPSFARQPAEYLDFLVDRLRRQRYDVLLPTHDQVFVLARYRESLGRVVGLAVPDFEAVRTLQSKVRFAELLAHLNLPQPAFRIALSPAELQQQQEYPCYVKREFSTAGRGVWHVDSPDGMRAVAEELQAASGPAAQRLLVQQPASGDYCVVQAVFQHGALLGAHCYTLRARGVGGSAHARRSVEHPQVIDEVAVPGKALDWHGALHLEYFVDPNTQSRQYLEGNPRIGETINATLAGSNLCELLVQVSAGQTVAPLPPSRPGVNTHSLMMSLLGVAERSGGRRELLAEMLRAWRGAGVYADSREELTPLDQDPLSLVPCAAVAGRLLLDPGQAESIIRGAVSSYSLDEEAVCRVLDLPGDCLAGRLAAITDLDGVRS